MDGIVFARRYSDEEQSARQFNDYWAWSSRELPAETSAWRTREDRPDSPFYLIVLDESGRSFDEFPWEGEPHELSPEQVAGFIARRMERQATGFLSGARGRVDERIHYEETDTPRLRGDGVWVVGAARETVVPPDFHVRDEGTIWLLWANSETATEWTREHLPDNTPTLGSAFVIEYRYIGPIVEGAREDGLIVEEI